MTNISQYEWWNKAVNGIIGSIHEGDPQSGFYRMRLSKGGAFVPVAVWIDDNGIQCQINGVNSPDKAADKWTFYCKYPITHEQYLSFEKTGKWHDDVASIGHNNAPEQTIQEEIAAVLAMPIVVVDSDDTCAQAQSHRARLLELSRKADKIREAEKKPHFEAGKAVDAQWQPLVKSTKDAADGIARLMSAYETDKAKKAAETARIQAEALRKIELEKIEASKGDQSQDDITEGLIDNCLEIGNILEAAASTPIKGSYGRAANVKSIKVATIVDQQKVYEYMKDRPEIKELLANLAQRAVNSGFEVPGVSIEEQRKVS